MMSNDVYHQSSSDHFDSNHPTKTKIEPAECPRPLLFQSPLSDPLQWGRPLLLFSNINNLFCLLLQQHQSVFSFASKHSFRSQGRDEDDGK
ncbi:hypothetical protein SUGI_0181960 [Cryptomeria japonica]|nr:hypothetical protein SUGI_0181960 [Cryptomeria japonica]